MKALDPSLTYVRLGADGGATAVPGGAAFWSRPEAELDAYGQDWLVSEFECDADWPNWEMHPHADELVYLLSGAATFVLDAAGGPQRVPLQGRGAVLVPRGVWHTAEVTAPSRMLFVTLGKGTEHRPARPARSG